MDLGFPKRSIITDRGYSVNYGGDGRYIYFPNRYDRTISVLDAASDTIIATINLNSIWSTGQFDGTFYRPQVKQIIALRSNHVIVIDADPSSGTFNAIIDNYTVTGAYSYNQSVIYDVHNDMLKAACGIAGIDLKRKLTVLSSTRNTTTTNAVYDTYFAHTNQVGAGFTNIPFMCNIDTNYPTYIFKDNPISNYTGVIFKIGNSLYIYNAGPNKFSIINKTDIEYKAIVSVGMGMLSYDNKNNKIFCTGGTGGEGRILDLASFTDAGTVQARTRSANESNNVFKAVFSEYSNKIYVQAYRNDLSATGCDRVHIYDLSLPLASCYVGYVTTGNNCVVNALLSIPVAKNRLHTTEYL